MYLLKTVLFYITFLLGACKTLMHLKQCIQSLIWSSFYSQLQLILWRIELWSLLILHMHKTNSPWDVDRTAGLIKITIYNAWCVREQIASETRYLKDIFHQLKNQSNHENDIMEICGKPKVSKSNANRCFAMKNQTETSQMLHMI